MNLQQLAKTMALEWQDWEYIHDMARETGVSVEAIERQYRKDLAIGWRIESLNEIDSVLDGVLA